MYEFRIISHSNMIAFCSLLFLLAAKLVSSSESAEKLYTGTCEIGDIVQNECIKCVCTFTKNVFECVKLNCTANATNVSIELSLQNPQKLMCHPNSAYVLDTVTCLCSINGTWPHSRCLSTFLALPPDNVTKEFCEPDSYVLLDCNVCRCGSDGRITTDRCTKNLCDKDKFVIKRRQGDADGLDPNSKCAPKNWYSFAPCQFCYCVNENKLVCNTGNRNEGKLLELGSYKLTVCGERLITDAQALVPTTERLLREGQKQDIPSYTSIPTTTKSQISADMEQHIAADFSDSDEKVMPNREGLSTQIPYEENDIEILSDETNENDMPIKAEDPKPPPPVSTTTAAAAANSNQMDFYNLAKLIQQGQNMLRNSQNYVNNQNLNGQDMNFPQMLDKILSMALRKSMVKLEPGQECEPGSTKKINCNTCFCLVNGKLLCTDKECT